MATIKQIAFVEKDQELVQKIEAYRTNSRLPSFIDAVRALCADALTFKEITK